ncbi:MAG: hypothetical protein ACKONH_02725 [Planctomycetia bacterium]
MPPPSIELFAYPWDIADRGVVPFAEECRRLGVTRLHVTTLYHSGKFLLPRHGGAKVFLPAGGTAYVPLDRGSLGELAPAEDALARTGWLADLAAQGLPLSAWTVFHHNSRIGGLHPGLTVRNAFGDSYPFALCPHHPAVRGYAVALARAIAALGLFDTLDLESIGWIGYEHGHHHEVAAGPIGPYEKFLLSLCFCPSCTAVARADGLDLQALAARVRALLLAKLAADDSGTRPHANMEQVAALVAQSPELQHLIRLRLDAVTGLVRDIAAAAGGAKVSVFTSSFVGSPGNIWMEGVSLRALRDTVDGFHLLAYTPDTDAVNDDLLYCLSEVADPARLNLTLNLGLPVTPALGDALAKIRFARAHGVRRFSFFNYGFLGAGRLDWIARIAAAVSNTG